MNNIALYIHIPFCVKKCAYCAFFSLAGSNEQLISSYFDALKKQISLLPPQKIASIYFGGGTPTFAGANRCADLLESVHKHHHVNDNAEITIEANPRTIDDKGLKSLANSGFNRISLGLQSGDDLVLRAMGRIHSVQDFICCYENAAKSGFSNISVDIIFGLPKEFGNCLDKTLNLVKNISPNHISAYSLSVECGTQLYLHKDSLSFPDEDEEESEYEAVCAAFSDYKHYEISSFAKDGFKSRHNSAYWNMTPYIGVGAAAHSFYENKRFSYPADVKSFIENADKPFGSSNYADALEETRIEIEEERIMLALRTSDGAILNEDQIKKAATAVKAGLAELHGRRLVLNEKGYRVSNEIIAEILA